MKRGSNFSSQVNLKCNLTVNVGVLFSLLISFSISCLLSFQEALSVEVPLFFISLKAHHLWQKLLCEMAKSFRSIWSLPALQLVYIHLILCSYSLSVASLSFWVHQRNEILGSFNITYSIMLIVAICIKTSHLESIDPWSLLYNQMAKMTT